MTDVPPPKYRTVQFLVTHRAVEPPPQWEADCERILQREVKFCLSPEATVMLVESGERAMTFGLKIEHDPPLPLVQAGSSVPRPPAVSQYDRACKDIRAAICLGISCDELPEMKQDFIDRLSRWLASEGIGDLDG